MNDIFLALTQETTVFPSLELIYISLPSTYWNMKLFLELFMKATISTVSLNKKIYT